MYKVHKIPTGNLPRKLPKQYVIIDCEFDHSVQKVRLMQISAIYYKNNQKSGKQLNQFITYPDMQYSHLMRVLNRFSGSAKSVESQTSVQQAITNIVEWFEQIPDNVMVFQWGGDDLSQVFALIANRKKSTKTFQLIDVPTWFIREYEDQMVNQIGLDDICEIFNLDKLKRHDAIQDVHLIHEAMLKMSNPHKKEELESLRQYFVTKSQFKLLENTIKRLTF